MRIEIPLRIDTRVSYNTLEEALDYVTQWRTVFLSSETLGSAITNSQPATLDCDSGIATIGTE